MLMLRTVEGIAPARFQQATGFNPLALFAETIRRHVSDGLLEADDERIALTAAGRLLADSVLADFVAPDPIRPPPAC